MLPCGAVWSITVHDKACYYLPVQCSLSDASLIRLKHRIISPAKEAVNVKSLRPSHFVTFD